MFFKGQCFLKKVIEFDFNRGASCHGIHGRARTRAKGNCCVVVVFRIKKRLATEYTEGHGQSKLLGGVGF